MQATAENQTDKKIAEVYQDLEHNEAYIYVVCKDRIYQFNAAQFTGFLGKYCRKSIATDDVGVPHKFDGEEPGEDWVRWQNRGDL